jgi:hypothetical protein
VVQIRVPLYGYSAAMARLSHLHDRSSPGQGRRAGTATPRLCHISLPLCRTHFAVDAPPGAKGPRRKGAKRTTRSSPCMWASLMATVSRCPHGPRITRKYKLHELSTVLKRVSQWVYPCTWCRRRMRLDTSLQTASSFAHRLSVTGKVRVGQRRKRSRLRSFRPSNHP